MRTGADQAPGPRTAWGDSASEPLVYVKKWVRTRHAIFFRLSNHTVQVIRWLSMHHVISPNRSFTCETLVRAAYVSLTHPNSNKHARLDAHLAQIIFLDGTEVILTSEARVTDRTLSLARGHGTGSIRRSLSLPLSRW